MQHGVDTGQVHFITIACVLEDEQNLTKSLYDQAYVRSSGSIFIFDSRPKVRHRQQRKRFRGTKANMSVSESYFGQEGVSQSTRSSAATF